MATEKLTLKSLEASVNEALAELQDRYAAAFADHVSKIEALSAKIVELESAQVALVSKSNAFAVSGGKRITELENMVAALEAKIEAAPKRATPALRAAAPRTKAFRKADGHMYQWSAPDTKGVRTLHRVDVGETSAPDLEAPADEYRGCQG